MIADLPSISKSTYGASTSTFALANIAQLNNDPPPPADFRNFVVGGRIPIPNAQQENTMAAVNKRRLVQVFIADPDENVPLEKSLLYTGSQKLTDATDQELYFEIDVQGLLKAHNEYRVTVINKKVKERTEMLEPARVRDLKMVVVDVAVF